MPKINREKLAELKISVPPEKEQFAITDYIMSKAGELVNLIDAGGGAPLPSCKSAALP